MPDIHRPNSIITELHLAFMWDCHNCGRENFVRAMVPNLGDNELHELRDEHGIQPWEAGKFTTGPGKVTCAHCCAMFRTDHYVGDDKD